MFSGEISAVLSLLSRVFSESGFKQLLRELLRDTHKAKLFVLVLIINYKYLINIMEREYPGPDTGKIELERILKCMKENNLLFYKIHAIRTECCIFFNNTIKY